MHVWFLVRHTQCNPFWNMAFDEALLKYADSISAPVLRFYGWQGKPASFGYFQSYSMVEQLTDLRPLVRRPTSGGLVLHDADWTYSLVFPPDHWWYKQNALQSYKTLHHWHRLSWQRLGIELELAYESNKIIKGFCFAGPDVFDLVKDNTKIAGAAQRRSKQGLLIQGSIRPPISNVTRDLWESTFCDVATGLFEISWQSLIEPNEILKMAKDLEESKYSTLAYNMNR